MRRILIGVAAIVAAVGAIGGGLAASTGRPTIIVGAVYPTAGSSGQVGLEEERGAALAAELANSRGGVQGQTVQLRLVPTDTAEAAPGVINRLHAQGISLVLGTEASVISAPASVAVAQDKMLMWETGAVGLTAPAAQPGINFFRAAPMGANLGKAAVDFVADQVAPRASRPGPLRYAVAYVDDVYGRAVAGGALADVSARQQILAGSFPYDQSTTDFGPLVARIAASHPDVLFVSAYMADAVALRRATAAARVPLLANIGTSSSYCMPPFGAQLGAEAVGLFASDKPDAAAVNPSTLSPAARAELAWAQRRYSSEFHQPMSAPALTGFTSAWALVGHVLPAAHGTEPSAVARTALAQHLPEGSLPNGSGLSFGQPGAPDAGENQAAVSVIWEWVGVNQRAVVWPPAYANHAITLTSG
jgi:ABC-type branched-subunit amino acid transport system substrate-binding protein